MLPYGTVLATVPRTGNDDRSKKLQNRLITLDGSVLLVEEIPGEYACSIGSTNYEDEDDAREDLKNQIRLFIKGLEEALEAL